MIRAVCALFVIGLICYSYSFAAGFSCSDNQVFSQGYVKFRNAGPLALTAYPFALSGQNVSIQTSYKSLYGLKELTENQIGITLQKKAIVIGGAFSSFGKLEYFHQYAGSLFSGMRFKAFRFGVSAIYSRLSFSENYSTLTHLAWHGGGSITKDDITVFAIGRNLNQPVLYDGGERLRSEVEIGLLYLSRSFLDSQIRFLFVRGESPTGAISQSVPIEKSIRVFWTLVLSPVRFGGGIEIYQSPVSFDYRITHHPVLGETHTVLLTVFP